MAEAPAPFSPSSVSQKTFSWQTACTATASSLPASGVMVGDPAPGSSRVISSSDERGAFSMMYLVPWDATTPLSRSVRMSARCACCCGTPPGARTRTASLSSTVATGLSPLASSVAPVETRSHMACATFSRGATSTAPCSSTTSASTAWSRSQAWSTPG